MGKSLGNFITLPELFSGKHEKLEQAYSPMTVRFFILQAHYRGTLDFSNEALQAAEKGLKRITQAAKDLRTLASAAGVTAAPALAYGEFVSAVAPAQVEAANAEVRELVEKVYEALCDDLNTPIALSYIFDAVRIINTAKDKKITLDKTDYQALVDLFDNIVAGVLGLRDEESEGGKAVQTIDGLVNITTYNAGVATLNARIDGTNNNLQAFIDEIELSKIYAHAAFHAEESETARNFTRGGGIDKQFKEILAGNGMSIGLSMDSNYKLTIDLKNKKGAVISSGMIDLPIESLITNASYGNKILTLTFQSGQTLKVSIADIVSGLVPETRKVNGKALSSDITLSAEDVGAYPKSDTYQKTEVGNLLSATKTELRQDIEGKQVVGYAYFSTETEKASGYIKGGQIDKEFTAIKKALASLNVSET